VPFVNGVYMVTPGTIVQINDSNFQAQPAIGGLVPLFIGPATDGQPNTPLTFSRPSDAVNALKGGDLLQGILLAFNPTDGNLNGASQVVAIRPEQATQATSAIGTAINLTTTSYGTLANLSKWMVTAGSPGYNVTLATDFVGPGG
jgi:hypothetical protein